MSPEEVYAILTSQIKALSAESIGAAVTQFLQDNPDYFLDTLGLYKDTEGYICQLTEGGSGT